MLRELVSSQLFNMYKNQFRIEVIDDRKVAEFLTKQTMDKMHNSKGVLNSLNFGSLDFIAKEGTNLEFILFIEYIMFFSL